MIITLNVNVLNNVIQGTDLKAGLKNTAKLWDTLQIRSTNRLKIKW